MNNEDTVKNLRIALNKTVSRGSAMDAFLRLLEGGVDFDTVRSAIVECGPATPRLVQKPGHADFKDLVVSFGKHRGKKLSEIAETAPSWLTWAIDNEISTEFFRQQCRKALELYDTENPHRSPSRLSRSLNETDAPSRPHELKDDDDVPF